MNSLNLLSPVTKSMCVSVWGIVCISLGDFQQLYQKLVAQFTSYLMNAMIGSIVWNYSLVGHAGLVLTLWWQKIKMAEICSFLPLSSELTTQLLSECGYLFSGLVYRNNLNLGLVGFWHSGGRKWLKIAEIDGFRPLSLKPLNSL